MAKNDFIIIVIVVFIIFLIATLTTASLNGSWVPKASRSFHYWQPAPSWRLLLWLANPGN